jgi:hypothetical protein
MVAVVVMSHCTSGQHCSAASVMHCCKNPKAAEEAVPELLEQSAAYTVGAAAVAVVMAVAAAAALRSTWQL